jgi:hypothetical protein
MRIPVLTVVTVFLLTTAANSEDKPKDQIGESTKKIKELQKEWISTLEAVADQSAKLYTSARIEYSVYLDAIKMLYKARLDVAEKESDRIEIHKKTIELLEKFMQLAKAKFEAARGTEMAMLSVKAMLLEVEIALEKTKLKEAKGGK